MKINITYTTERNRCRAIQIAVSGNGVETPFTRTIFRYARVEKILVDAFRSDEYCDCYWIHTVEELEAINNQAPGERVEL